MQHLWTIAKRNGNESSMCTNLYARMKVRRSSEEDNRDELVFISTVSLVADPCRLPSNLVPERRQP